MRLDLLIVDETGTLGGGDPASAAVRGCRGGSARWPCGTPVICLRNRDDLGLANGDLGVVVGDAPATGPDSNLDSNRDFQRWLIFGPDPSQRLHPAQLAGAVEPALALTVHKAQTSEAEEVIVLVPPGEPRDPRLLYTALTRARQRALLVTGRTTGRT